MLANLNPLVNHTIKYFDELKDAIKKGCWNTLESMIVGKDVDGNDVFFKQNVWAIIGNSNEDKLNLVFTQHNKKIERNISNQIKCIALVSIYYSQDMHSLKTISERISLLKCIAELMLEVKVNDFSLFDIALYQKLGRLQSKRDIYERHFLSALNFINKNHYLLSFNLKNSHKITSKSINSKVKEAEQTVVIPPRIYYSLIDDCSKHIDFISKNINDFHKAIDIYVDYIKQRKSWVINKIRNKEKSGLLYEYNFESDMKKLGFEAYSYKDDDQLWEQAFNKVKPVFRGIRSYPNCKIMTKVCIGNKSYNSQEFSGLLQKTTRILSILCMLLSGMRIDETWRLHPVHGEFKENIDGIEHCFFSTRQSKISGNSQTREDIYVTTQTGIAAFNILKTIRHSYQDILPKKSIKRLFISFYQEIFPVYLSRSGLKGAIHSFVRKTADIDLKLTEEDMLYLQISDPSQKKNHINKPFQFSTHQCRRSLSYYLIGYELADFPQLKQQLGHYSMFMTRWYANNASRFNSFRKELEEQRVSSQAVVYLRIYNAMANKERIGGGKGKAMEVAVQQLAKTGKSYFEEGVNRDMLSLDYWEAQIRTKQAHLHAIAPGMYCTNNNCSMRINIELAECVDCEFDLIESAAYAETSRIEATRHLILADDLGDLNPSLASKCVMQIRAAEQIMKDLEIDFEIFTIPINIKSMLIDVNQF
tara:strand:- start:1850 stop:3958 length:2109 start_codon:yes stop_codon:yes gene_type:complete